MAIADIEPSPEQNATEDVVTESPDFEPVPEKRKNRARWVSLIIFTSTTILVLAFCIAKRNVDVYRPDTTQKNTTNKYYIKEERLAFSSLLATALGLFGVALGTLVDRLSLINEERHHLHTRYRGSRKKMVKACFSGISWYPVFALLGSTAIIVIILIFLRVNVTGKPWFDLEYLVYIFSGIGVGPLIMHLLNLNTQSEVHISTILEEKGLYVAHGLAYSYYLNYLKEALPKFKEARRSRFPAPHEHVRLTSNKLLLLMPLDCYMTDDLKELDDKILKLFDTGNDHDPFRFPVYHLEVREREYKYFAIQYVKEPLRTLEEMSTLEEFKAVKRKTREEEVKLLYRTLSGILEKPPNQVFKETCTIVPILAKKLSSLQNGGLVRCIMDIVQPSYDTQADGVPAGFVKPKESKEDVTKPSKSNKATTKCAQTVKNREGHSAIQNEQQGRGEEKQIDSDTRNKHDDESNDRKGKSAKILKRKYKNNKSDGTELQVMIPAENLDPYDIKPKSNETQKLVQEVGDENDSGASTSENYRSEIERIAGGPGSRQSDQQDEHSSNNNQDHTESEL